MAEQISRRKSHDPPPREEIVVHWKRQEFRHAISKSTDWCVMFEDVLMVTDKSGQEFYYPYGDHLRWTVK